MKIISAFPWRRAADTAADVAGDVFEAETAAARSLWASRAVVWPAILLLVAFVGVGCFVGGHAVATAGVKNLQRQHVAELATRDLAIGKAEAGRQQAERALAIANLRLAELSPKPSSDAPAISAPSAADKPSSLPAERPPKRRVKSAVKPAAADGGFIGAMWKTITGG